MSYRSPIADRSRSTLTLDENCTGSALFTNGRAFDFVVVDGGREMYWIQTNPGAVVTATLTQQD